MFPILNFLHSEDGRWKMEDGRWKMEEWTRYLCRAVLRASEVIAKYFSPLSVSHSQLPDLVKSREEGRRKMEDGRRKNGQGTYVERF
ncbi:hypothetical protein IQ269_05960 [Tychonema sp. LEGE 07199]|uniref:hypothetical protein n=1 Tax=unclassified Tychonema TaxID=2642144 RepID=UPI0018818795|nr:MULTISPECIES: hypothetical protein [unclassified Tychonema]MBE9120367.1 hypothetical protein [Tychonema sp. LEGE 07199]MBE9130661.1 hypothetical protein [Tychonema sp. LEGE 07196]